MKNSEKKTKQPDFISKISQIKSSKNNRLLLPIIILIVIASFLLIKLYQESKKNYLKNEVIPKVVKKILQNDNANIEINNLKENDGVYQFELVLKDQNNTKYTSYVTKNGNLFFTSGININDLLKKQPTTNQNKKLSCQDLKKSTAPKLTTYVMANCPYGLQMQRVFKNLINNDENIKNNLRVAYIFNQDSNFETGELTSLHGKEEADENLRQICIREEQSDLYWPYVSCYMQKENNSENCLANVGIDTVSLNQCLTDKNRGLEYAKKDFEETKKLGVGGSPTLVLNDQQIVQEFDFGGRNPNAIKEILCCSADKKLAYCNKEFSKNNVAVSFSETDEQVAGTSTGGGCN